MSDNIKTVEEPFARYKLQIYKYSQIWFALAVKCEAIPHVDNSTSDVITSNYTDIVTYTCHKGYSLPGGHTTAQISCNADGIFHVAIAACSCMFSSRIIVIAKYNCL